MNWGGRKGQKPLMPWGKNVGQAAPQTYKCDSGTDFDHVIGRNA